MQIAEGMAYLHSDLPEKTPIIHKDLKPENIMISKNKESGYEFQVKIVDLGISGLTKL